MALKEPGDLHRLTPPILVVSRAGWATEGEDVHDLFNAAPNDDLSEWQGMVIYDSAGKLWRTEKVWRLRPRSRFGLMIFRALGMGAYLEVTLSEPMPYSEAELRDRIVRHFGASHLRPLAKNVRELLEHLCQ